MRRRELHGGRYLRRAAPDRPDRSRRERRDAVDEHRHHSNDGHERHERKRLSALRVVSWLRFLRRRCVCLLRWLLGILRQPRLGWRERIGRCRHVRRGRNDDLRLRLRLGLGQRRRWTRVGVLPAESGRLLAGLQREQLLTGEQLERVVPGAALESDLTHRMHSDSSSREASILPTSTAGGHPKLCSTSATVALAPSSSPAMSIVG
jgi:hypothetical protein